jgi:hypothetical protein
MTAAGLPTAGGEIPVRDVVMEVVGHSSGRVAATLAVVEDLLVEEDGASRVALEFLEALQNAASHGAEGLLTTEELLPLRGPRTVSGWDQSTGSGPLLSPGATRAGWSWNPVHRFAPSRILDCDQSCGRRVGASATGDG